MRRHTPVACFSTCFCRRPHGISSMSGQSSGAGIHRSPASLLGRRPCPQSGGAGGVYHQNQPPSQRPRGVHVLLRKDTALGDGPQSKGREAGS